jgi:DNA-binding NtrC family response regulator
MTVSARGGTAGAMGRGRVVIVDDDASMAETLTLAMNRRGFVARWTTSALDALELVEQGDLDVVVTDLHMDGMDGMAFCARVVARWPEIPVVIITGFGSKDTAAAALRVGALEFMTKPFGVESLCLVLARAVQHRVARAKRQSRPGSAA